MRFILYILVLLGGFFYFSTESQRYEKIEDSYSFAESASKEYIIDDYFSADLFVEKITARYVESLSNSELAGLVFMPAYESQHDYDDLKKWIQEYHVGGFMVLRSDYDTKDARYVESLTLGDGLPLFKSIDAEPSLVKYRLPRLKNIPSTNTIDSIRDSINVAARISDYIHGLGMNINFAPVYDSNENTSVIGDRSYGSNSKKIHTLASAFSEESLSWGIIPTSKHFPGHGSVSGDTHKDLQTISGELLELDQFELAIKDNVPMIMVGHLAIENNDNWSTAGVPASLSYDIVTGLLRDDLGYQGLVATDALNMGALNRFENKEIMALRAGVDILLLPENIDTSYRQVRDEVEKNPEFKLLLQEKARRIIKMKYLLKKQG